MTRDPALFVLVDTASTYNLFMSTCALTYDYTAITCVFHKNEYSWM